MRHFVAGWLLAIPLFASPAELEKAKRLYDRTDYRGSLEALAAIASDGGLKAGAAQEMIGRNYFMMADYKKASEAFEKAVAADPANSNYHLWLGRSYGRRAETANPFSAPGLASKARQSFEKSVALNGENLEAVNDLFSYYLEAPGFLGGGLGKADDLAKRIHALDPSEYEYALAKIAEERKDWNQAEQHWRRATELAPRQVGRILDLAKFFAKRGRHQESEAAFSQAEKIAPESAKVLFERANYYIGAKKNLPAARELLQRYLKAPLTPDDPSREEAQRLLKQAGA